jgi:hypothetical protein
VGFVLSFFFFFFFKENDVTVTATSDRYCAMLENFLLPKLDDVFDKHATENVLFQQDGATAHTSHRSLGTLKGMFLGMLSPCVVISGGRRICQIEPERLFSLGLPQILRYTNIVPKLWNVLRRR